MHLPLENILKTPAPHPRVIDSFPGVELGGGGGAKQISVTIDTSLEPGPLP